MQYIKRNKIYPEEELRELHKNCSMDIGFDLWAELEGYKTNIKITEQTQLDKIKSIIQTIFFSAVLIGNLYLVYLLIKTIIKIF